MNSPNRWPKKSPGASRCGGSGPFWPASCSAPWRPGLRGLAVRANLSAPAHVPRRIRAKPSASVATKHSRTPAWRPATRAAATLVASASPAAATTAPTSPTTSITVGPAATRVRRLVPTNTARASTAVVCTSALTEPSAAPGRAPSWPPIRTTAAPAATSAAISPRTAIKGPAAYAGQDWRPAAIPASIFARTRTTDCVRQRLRGSDAALQLRDVQPVRGKEAVRLAAWTVGWLVWLLAGPASILHALR